MAAYYNEIDPYAAKWLRNLIAAGHIASGDVDERSIEDVSPDDLRGYRQCHFFAGIGVWSYALRRAGWDDTQRVWTGSCPCQPFSAAGKGAGFTDERHLWPAFHWLIEQCRPAAIFGEQVASKDANPWIDLVSTDLEALGYAVGAVAFPAAGVGAPHIRDRLYWVADADGRQLDGVTVIRGAESNGQDAGRAQGFGEPGACGELRGVADATGTRPSHRGAGVALAVASQADGSDSASKPSPTNGPWRDADWLLCRDGKWRPVEPGTFPLAHGAASRVGRLRAYGNAVNAEAAEAFIRSAMEAGITA
nr:DNA cytosine methyltransferase [Pseudomonas sp.]